MKMKWLIGILFLVITLSIFGSYYVQRKQSLIQGPIDTSGPYDVNVSIKLNVSLENNVKKFDTNIFKAARTAIFGWNANRSARYAHYKYNLNGYVDIFEVLQIGPSTWEVRYRFKNKLEETYDTRFYSTVIVEKDKVGRYNGSISGSSPEDQGITY